MRSLPVLLLMTLAAQDGGAGVPWKRHVIDDSSTGADGVRLGDANGDGLPDIVTGWEQGGEVRICFHPGREKVRSRWPSVLAGKAGDVEDALLTDLDGDGTLDVVSCSEGKTRTILIHWGPKDRDRLLDAGAWRSEALPESKGSSRWMFALPLQVDGKNGVDIVAGGKDKGAAVGWFEAPPDPRALGEWKWHPVRDAGWIMSLIAADMDGDGDADIVFSDRKGPRSGCFWLENPSWEEHRIGAPGREVMFMTLADLDRDGLLDAVAAVKPREILFMRRLGRDGRAWDVRPIPMPPESGTAKAVAAGDIDLDGTVDLVFTCEEASKGKHGVMAMVRRGESWESRPVSGPDGVKYDLAALLDIDGDGDIDVLTCEEVRNLGVIWYENPAKP